MGFGLVVYPTYAVVDRPDPADDRRVPAYDHRAGWGDPTNSAESASDGPVAVALGRFNISATVGIERGAPDTLHMEQSDVKTTYLVVGPATDPTTPGALLSVYVSSNYGGGFIAFAGDGAIKQINPPS
jgi:hypothetical protein